MVLLQLYFFLPYMEYMAYIQSPNLLEDFLFPGFLTEQVQVMARRQDVHSDLEGPDGRAVSVF